MFIYHKNCLYTYFTIVLETNVFKWFDTNTFQICQIRTLFSSLCRDMIPGIWSKLATILYVHMLTLPGICHCLSWENLCGECKSPPPLEVISPKAVMLQFISTFITLQMRKIATNKRCPSYIPFPQYFFEVGPVGKNSVSEKIVRSRPKIYQL